MSTEPTRAEIASVRWENELSGVRGESSVTQLAQWLLEGAGYNFAYVLDQNRVIQIVLARRDGYRRAYVQAHDETDWTDALLSLPRY